MFERELVSLGSMVFWSTFGGLIGFAIFRSSEFLYKQLRDWKLRQSLKLMLGLASFPLSLVMGFWMAKLPILTLFCSLPLTMNFYYLWTVFEKEG